MEKLIFKDKYGNKLFKKYIKTRDIWQYYGKNANGSIVNTKGLQVLLNKAKIHTKVPKGIGIDKVVAHFDSISKNCIGKL